MNASLRGEFLGAKTAHMQMRHHFNGDVELRSASDPALQSQLNNDIGVSAPALENDSFIPS